MAQKVLRVHPKKALILLAIGVISGYFWIYLSGGKITGYGDAISKLTLARRIFFNQGGEFSIAQGGGVWPSMHIFPLIPLVWWDKAYWSGVAGAIPAMIAYVVMIGTVYELVALLTRSKMLGVVGALIPLLNINVIYLAVTPMSESLFLAVLMLVTLGIFKLEESTTSFKWTAFLGLSMGFSTQVRYEFWFLTGFSFLLLSIRFFQKGIKGYELLARLSTLFFPPGVFVLYWLCYQGIIFDHPLFFATSKYSATKIEMSDPNRHQAVHDLAETLRIFVTAVRWNLPLGVFAIGCTGILLYLIQVARKQERSIVPIYLLGLPFFACTSLFLGQAAIDLEYAYNVRSGTTVVPLMGIGVSLTLYYLQMLDFKRITRPLNALLVAIVITSSLYWMYTPFDSPVVLKITELPEPGLAAITAFVQYNYDDGLVLAESVGSMTTLQFKAKIPTEVFVNEGQAIYQKALEEPSTHVSWVFVKYGDEVDSTFRNYPERFKEFDKVFENEWGYVLHR